jgi:hypothetical protein
MVANPLFGRASHRSRRTDRGGRRRGGARRLVRREVQVGWVGGHLGVSCWVATRSWFCFTDAPWYSSYFFLFFRSAPLCTSKVSENGGFLSLETVFPVTFIKKLERADVFHFFPRLGGIPSEVALARSTAIIDRRFASFGCSDLDRTELPKFRVPLASESLLRSVRELNSCGWKEQLVTGVEFDQICLATKRTSTTS